MPLPRPRKELLGASTTCREECGSRVDQGEEEEEGEGEEGSSAPHRRPACARRGGQSGAGVTARNASRDVPCLGAAFEQCMATTVAAAAAE